MGGKGFRDGTAVGSHGPCFYAEGNGKSLKGFEQREMTRCDLGFKRITLAIMLRIDCKRTRATRILPLMVASPHGVEIKVERSDFLTGR